MKIVFLTLFSLSLIASAQTQTVRGTVRDKETQLLLKDAIVRIDTRGADSGKTAISGENGEFNLVDIRVGRKDFTINLGGYKSLILNNIIVSSGKEVVLNLEMEEDVIQTAEITIKAKPKQGQPNNENALVSARAFTVDETDRFAGSRGDPARMASNFAGVQGADDSRNDIVVRGNSPGGILWRVEGIDIQNPNHFAIPGTTGGPLSIINNKFLANSDFFTGAFPAEYNNSTAGVFDLKLRNGNNKKREYSSQFGLFGWDALAEGPFNKKKNSSFLVGYRYSTLAIFSALKINLGTNALPKYQDLNFKLNFQLKNKASLSFFGMGGTSNINILISDQKESTPELYGDNDRDQKFGSAMGIIGGTYLKTINIRSYFRVAVSMSSQQITSDHKLVFRHNVDTTVRDGETYYKYALDSLVPNQHYQFRTNTQGINLFLNTKLNGKATLRYGMQVTRYGFHFHDSARNVDFMDTANYWMWRKRWNSDGTGLMLMPYVQGKWKLSSLLTLSAGVTAQIYSIQDKTHGLSNISADFFQPRIGMRYQLNRKQSLNLGLGAHSQVQSAYTYFYLLQGNSVPHNLNMGLTKSKHAVLSYDILVGKDKRIKFETYYQSLSNLPVSKNPSSFSLANTGSGFSRFFPDSLKNTGTGENYGVELTIEKFFTHGYYFMVSTSFFEAKYAGSDGVKRNSDFNTNYAANGLFAKEWKVSKHGTLNLGGKITMAGARRYSPMDTLMTRREREYNGIDALKNTQRFGNPYRRFDIRISYKINAKKVTHEIAFDLINITNRKNILKYSYISEPPYARQTSQLGFLPVFYYKIDF